MIKKWSYGLYDVANSAYPTFILTFVFAPYFVSHIFQGEESIGAAYWQWTSGACGLSVAFFALWLGFKADQYKDGLKKGLILSSILCILAIALLYLAYPNPRYVSYTLVVFYISCFFYELCILFSNAILTFIGKKKDLGDVSGFAFAVGYFFPSLLFIFVLFFILDPKTAIFNLDRDSFEHIRITTILVSIWFFVLSLPLYFTLKSISIPKSKSNSMISSLKKLIWKKKFTNLFKFLIARMLYADGFLVLATGGGVYAKTVIGFSTKQLLILAIIGSLVATVSSYLGGKLNVKYGSKKIIFVSVNAILVATVIMSLATSKSDFWVGYIMVAIFCGPMQSASRTLMAHLTPVSEQGKGFGLFTFAGKSTAFVGPILVGTVTYFTSQRYGMASVSVLFLISLFILLRTELPKSY